MERRALITGASGLVGRAVATAFEQDGWQVQRLGRDTVDLAATDDLARIIPAPPTHIIHLAAEVPSGATRPDSHEAGGATRRMDTVICRAARSWQCRLLYASSCGLYRRDLPAIKDEAAPVSDWHSPYFAAKLAGEAAMLNLPNAAVLRLSSPIGANLPPHLVMARFIALAKADAMLPLFGDGSREQDFISLDDLGQLFLAAAKSETHGIFNAASGAATTMAGLAAAIIAFTGKGRVALSGQPEGNDCLYARYDISRARRDLGWMPQRSLADMIRDAAGECP